MKANYLKRRVPVLGYCFFCNLMFFRVTIDGVLPVGSE